MFLSPAKSPFLFLSYLFFLKPRIVSQRSRNLFLPFRYFFLLLSPPPCHFHLFSCITPRRRIVSSRLSYQACTMYTYRIHAGIYAVTCTRMCARLVDNCGVNQDERGRKLVRLFESYAGYSRVRRRSPHLKIFFFFFHFVWFLYFYSVGFSHVRCSRLSYIISKLLCTL